MPLGINNFQSVSRGLFEREIKMENESVRTSSVTRTTARLQGWLRQRDAETQKQIHVARYKVKETFIESLGLHRDDVLASLKAIGISEDFLENNRPLTNRIVKKMLHATQQYRKESVKTAPITLPAPVRLRPEPGKSARNPSRVGQPATVVATQAQGAAAQLWQKNAPVSRATGSEVFSKEGLARLAAVFPNISELLEADTPLRNIFTDEPTLFASNMLVKWPKLGADSKAMTRALLAINIARMLPWTMDSESALLGEMNRAKQSLAGCAESLRLFVHNYKHLSELDREVYIALAKDMERQAQIIHEEMSSLSSACSH